jgi:murein DD-endopeptidase MepM/ murein hydrolase activator NlpD
MNIEFGSGHRVPPWIALVAALLAIWLLFGRGSGSGAVISGWSGDGTIAAQSAAGPINPAQQSLSGLFSKQGAQGTGLAADPHPQDTPWGNPTDSSQAVMTQGYGVGSHAPAAVWGGIDIAIDGNGDGAADPQGSMGAPLYATMSGVIELKPDSMPAGNHLWIKNEHYKVGYGHLKAFAVPDGATVKRGDLIGYMGSTGQSSGPHLHYHIWKDGVNVNPLEYGAMP